MRASKLTWYVGLTGVVLSGALNAVFLIQSTHMVKIQVPTHTLEPYQPIKAKDVTIKRVSAKSLNADTMKGNVVGRVTSMMIPKGDPIQRFEIAKQDSMAQVIQNLYQTHPNYAFADIQVQSDALSQVIQPNEHVTLMASGHPYQNVWVLSVNNPNAQRSNAGSQWRQSVHQFVRSATTLPATTSTPHGTLTFLVGGPWSTIETLMNAGTVRAVVGNTQSPQRSLGSPPVNGSTTSASSQKTAMQKRTKMGGSNAK